MITSDVNLRVGKGPAAVGRICEEHGGIPTIYITATPEDCEGCPEDMVLPKPLDEARVRRAFLAFAPI